jgi:type I restriction enzyme R subunit
MIDRQLELCGWVVQDRKSLDLGAGRGVAVREYPTDSGPADYILFVDRKPAGVIEAKREDQGLKLTAVEEQAEGYAKGRLKYLDNESLPFVYESTGALTRFTDFRDPKPRSREVFAFARPETLAEWLEEGSSLRSRLLRLPAVRAEGLRDCQVSAIENLETSFREFRPRALVQMATGAGKTFTAITAIYHLLKFAGARRILFLVDTKNLGEQAEQEFMNFKPQDENRLFTSLYTVQRLSSSHVSEGAQVCIGTIQRLYSMLKGEEFDEEAEVANPAEADWSAREPLPVVYGPGLPPEFFDFIVIDECHRSIYNLWKQVLEYFDAFLVGLTATPDKRTFGFFNQNIVSEYSHEDAVADGVNVGYDIFLIETKITKRGASLKSGEFVDFREKLSRKKRWAQLDEDYSYGGAELDRDVVNPNQIRAIAKAYRDLQGRLFPGRAEVPKTLVFAKTDSHADDIIQIFREEFGEGNEFCKKVTYRTEEDPKSVLSQFRNSYYPRVAVTVDMIATGTDVKPLECLIFMRDVRSRNYFEQMKGRGTRTLSLDDLRKVTPSARNAKDHFLIVDAVGVTKSLKTDSRPLDTKRGVPLGDLLRAVAVGARDEELLTSLAGRLARLDRVMTEKEKEGFSAKAKGLELSEVVKGLLSACDPDRVEAVARKSFGIGPASEPSNEELMAARAELADSAAGVFTGEIASYLENARRAHEQIVDTVNPDSVETAGWSEEVGKRARSVVDDFGAYLEANKDEILALQILYSQPWRRRELDYAAIEELRAAILRDRPNLAPLSVWAAYERLEAVDGSPANELTALVSLVRRASGIDARLCAYDRTVDRNFKKWIFERHSGSGTKFNEEEMDWLRLIKEHIAMSFRLELDDLDLAPFENKGGRGAFWRVFGDKSAGLIEEMSENLAG